MATYTPNAAEHSRYADQREQRPARRHRRTASGLHPEDRAIPQSSRTSATYPPHTVARRFLSLLPPQRRWLFNTRTHTAAGTETHP